MSYNSEKLDNFTRTIMQQAAKKREAVLKEAQDRKKELLEKKELELLEQAYTTIQKEIRKIDNEKNQMISCAVMESKKKLFKKREEIINKVFNELTKRIVDFKNSSEYEEFVFKNLQEGCNAVGDGQILAYFNNTDMQIAHKIADRINRNIEIYSIEEDIIGGCKVLNKTKNLLIDNSLKNMINQQKECFLEISGLTIE